ncbi:MAG TPA: response regulator [Acidimicrobiia bacterium]|nr:response regulator [Acidimicrobiia bacterium]
MPSVLIVDDEPDVRFLVRSLIEEAEWRVAGEAGSGEEALSCWRELRPDAIVLDHRMPGLTGLEAAAAILAEEGAPPIILFTVAVDELLGSEAAAIGIRTCVSKDRLGLLMEALVAHVSQP